MKRIFEVGPRDGLQNESKVLTVQQKLSLIEGLVAAGLKDIEIGSFVRPDRVPQMAGTDELYRSETIQHLLTANPGVRFWSLVPNEKGLDRALECGVKQIAVFGGATESFVRKNIGMSIEQSLQTFAAVIQRAQQQGIRVRGYVSVCWVCPYEGPVPVSAVVSVVQKLLEMGVEEVSLGDTVGRAHPVATEELLTALLKLAPPDRFAVHFHDTYGMALANIDRSLKMGISVIDSSIGGLGGCPYAAGATGNVATEDVYTLLEGYTRHGVQTQILDAERLLETAAYAQTVLEKTLPSKRLAAWPGKK